MARLVVQSLPGLSSGLIRIVGILAVWMMPSCSPTATEADRRKNSGASNAPLDGDATCLALADAPPGYEVQVKDLMTKWCFPCHDENGQKQLPYLSTYEQVKTAASASKRAIEAGNMPRPPQVMPESERAVFAAWVTAQMPKSDGAPTGGNVASSAPVNPATTTVGKKAPKTDCSKGGGNLGKSTTTQNPANSSAPNPTAAAGSNISSALPNPNAVNYASIIGPYIDAKCASCHRPGGTPPVVADYNSTKATAARSLIRIKANTMPPLGGNSAKEMADFESWVQSGMPQ